MNFIIDNARRRRKTADDCLNSGLILPLRGLKESDQEAQWSRGNSEQANRVEYCSIRHRGRAIFNREALIAASRVDQAGESTFPEFLASWRAGVVRYEVDFAVRTVAYFGCNGEEYVEAYPAVEISTEPQ
jgi:hypothetical protein